MTLVLFCDRCTHQVDDDFDGRMRIKHTHAIGTESKRKDTVVDLCPECATGLEKLIQEYVHGDEDHHR